MHAVEALEAADNGTYAGLVDVVRGFNFSYM